ncbi:lipid II flippase MurJ [Accumulibacter sp.]|uniref:lipid II flippase MurJ n=1 Tax=Accumulibacter sp. TaxID=2053492 RepID=UPI002611C9CE|nr:lipid II flippase MurJ [Accumulibacter sp.]
MRDNRRRWHGALLQLTINAVGKGLAFLREVMVSSLFGVSHVTDAYFAIQQLLSFVLSYMMGAFNLAFVPAYARYDEAKRGGSFLRPIFYALVCLATALSITLAMLPPEHLALFLGFRHANPLLDVFAEILTLAILPIVVTGVAFGVLHGERAHIAATLLAGIQSAAMLVALVFFYLLAADATHLTQALPWSYTIGTFLTGIIALAVLKKRIKKADSRIPALEFYNFGRSLAASSIENIGFNLNQLSNVYFAARLGEGLVAVNAFAMRIGMLPLSLVSSQLGQIYQSAAARAMARDTALPRITFFLFCLPNVAIALAMAMFGEALVRLIYERGSFSPEHTAIVTALIFPYSIYFFVMSTNQLAARHYFAAGAGPHYTAAMTVAYVFAFAAKSVISVTLADIVWACVVAEGAVAIWLSASIALGKK